MAKKSLGTLILSVASGASGHRFPTPFSGKVVAGIAGDWLAEAAICRRFLSSFRGKPFLLSYKTHGEDVEARNSNHHDSVFPQQFERRVPMVRGRCSLMGSLYSRSFHSTSKQYSKSFYDILEVSRGASDAEIKKGFYKLAKKYHPDTNKNDPGAAKKFQEVQRAYDTLRDKEKRSVYDQLGHDAYVAAEASGGAPGGGAAGGGPFGAGMHVDPEDLFREFFGAGGRQSGGFEGTIFEFFGGSMGGAGGFRPRKGRSIQAALTITFEEAVKGTKRVLDSSSLGIQSSSRNNQPIEIAIPAGVDNGFQMRVEGQGMPGPQGLPPGDLLLQIMVLPSHKFQRDGFDIYTEIRIGIADAILGTTAEVPTIDGKAEVKIKSGTQPGDKLRMRGYGIAMDLVGQRGRRGDQYVTVKVQIPKTITKRQEELLEEFRGGKMAGPGPGWEQEVNNSTSDNSSTKHRKSSDPSDSSTQPSSKQESLKNEGTKDTSGSEQAEGEATKKKKKGWFSFGG